MQQTAPKAYDKGMHYGKYDSIHLIRYFQEGKLDDFSVPEEIIPTSIAPVHFQSMAKQLLPTIKEVRLTDFRKLRGYSDHDGFSLRTRDSEFIIFLDTSLTQEEKIELLHHEVAHCILGHPRYPYHAAVLDNQYENEEQEAKKLGHELYYAKGS